MKKVIKAATLMVALCFGASAAIAGGVREMASVEARGPVNPAHEFGYVRHMTKAYKRAKSPKLPNGSSYTLNVGSGVPAPNLGAANVGEVQNNNFVIGTGTTVSGSYLILKWGAISEVYYVGGLSMAQMQAFSFANNVNYEAINNWQVFEGDTSLPTQEMVPDAGSSLTLLGLGALAILGVRRYVLNPVKA